VDCFLSSVRFEVGDAPVDCSSARQARTLAVSDLCSEERCMILVQFRETLAEL